MSAPDVGRTRFQDGMRVASEHLEHLQTVLLDATHQGRVTGGLGKVVFGLQVTLDGASVTVGEGLAIDRSGRLLASPAPVTLDGTAGYLVILHRLRADGLVKGVPTLLFDDVSFEARTAPPPYDDDAVVFARVGDGVEQRGEWYLPPLDHTHSGTFVERGGRWRYDGDALGMAAASFDSRWVEEADSTLAHGLASTDLVVQVQAMLPSGVVTVQGLGAGFWYELPDAGHIRLVHDGSVAAVRAVAWPLAAPVGNPVADAGLDVEVEPGVSFTLRGDGSRAANGRTIVKYIWTQTS